MAFRVRLIIFLIVKTEQIKHYAGKLYFNVQFTAGKTQFGRTQSKLLQLQAHNQQMKHFPITGRWKCINTYEHVGSSANTPHPQPTTTPPTNK